MSAKQPTFKQRIRLLEIASSEIATMSGLFLKNEQRPRMDEVASILDAEIERMKLANERWELQRQARKNAKTAPKGTALQANSTTHG